MTTSATIYSVYRHNHFTGITRYKYAYSSYDAAEAFCDAQAAKFRTTSKVTAVTRIFVARPAGIVHEAQVSEHNDYPIKQQWSDFQAKQGRHDPALVR